MGDKTNENLRKLYLGVEQAAQEKVDKAIRNGGLRESEIDIFQTQDIIIQYLEWVHKARVAFG